MKKISVATAIVVFFFMVAFTVIIPNPAKAITTVDLDAVINGVSNPVSISLATGTYKSSAVPTPDSIGEDSWNAWLYCGTTAAVNVEGSVPYASGLKGWLNRYVIEVDSTPVVVWDGMLHETPELAFLSTPVHTFDVVSDPNVLFYIEDSYSKDNSGGISLEISNVPIPGALWLLGSGLIGLVGIRKRLKS